MIINGKNSQIGSQSALPQMGEVLLSWFQSMTFDLVTKTLEDYDLKETVQTIATKGVRQPFTSQQLSIKPEGQRAWRWETLHCLPDVKLNPDDIVIFNTVRYRVMQKLDYSEYGYLEYHIVQDYKEAEDEQDS